MENYAPHEEKCVKAVNRTLKCLDYKYSQIEHIEKILTAVQDDNLTRMKIYTEIVQSLQDKLATDFYNTLYEMENLTIVNSNILTFNEKKIKKLDAIYTRKTDEEYANTLDTLIRILQRCVSSEKQDEIFDEQT